MVLNRGGAPPQVYVKIVSGGREPLHALSLQHGKFFYLDQGWTQCPTLNVVLYQVLPVSEQQCWESVCNPVVLLPNSLPIVLLCLCLSICIVCVCTLWTSCLSQNLWNKKKLNKITKKYIFTTYLNSGGREPKENSLRGAWWKKGWETLL